VTSLSYSVKGHAFLSLSNIAYEAEPEVFRYMPFDKGLQLVSSSGNRPVVFVDKREQSFILQERNTRKTLHSQAAHYIPRNQVTTSIPTKLLSVGSEYNERS
jgi:hypothetical protein